MKNLIFLVVLIFSGLSESIYAQRNCGTMENLERLKREDPSVSIQMEQIEQHISNYTLLGANRSVGAVYNIPVVVHVLYNTTTQNISDVQIQSQIKILNDDFRRLNADKVNTPSTFAGVAADAEINFCLATKDPAGATTTGITRTYTSATSFDHSDKMKYSTSGGKNAWPAGSYLNIWVCNLGGGLLGYAQFPGGPAASDGVVLGYKYVGNTGTATAPFNKGRTATHEVGHWLNLRHIWGDASCGNDYVSDTPVHSAYNYGCPTHPKTNSCGTSAEQFMNYMDYTDDGCMNMFTLGQKARMQAVLASGGARASLAASTACGGITTVSTCNTPTGLSVSGITASGAILAWSSTGSSSYNIRYKSKASTSWITVSATSNSKAITGLAASTAYEFQVQSACSGSYSSYSTSGNFTTNSILTIGTSASITGIAPYSTGYMDEKIQFIVTKSELVAAGYTTANSVIKAMAFNVYSASTQALSGFSIRMCHTTSASFSSTTFKSTTNMITVHSSAKAIATGWNTHTFTTPFTYNGVDNVLVEICWNNSSYSVDSKVYSTTQSTYKTLYKRANVASGGVCANTTGALSYARPNIKLTLGSATSSGKTEGEESGESVAEDEENYGVLGKQEISLELYPNPVSTDLTITYNLIEENSKVSYSIYNLLGALIERQELEDLSVGEHSFKLNIKENARFQSMSNGVYMLSLEVNGEALTEKFILMK